MNNTLLQALILTVGVGALVFVLFLVQRVLREKEGTPAVRDISKKIRVGATVFLRREFQMLAVFTAVMCVILVLFVPPRPMSAVAYLLGTIAAGAAAFIGMSIGTRANGRTATAASKSWDQAMKIAYSAGAVMGFSVVGLGLLGLTVLVIILNDYHVTLSFAFGASAVALFLRVGGGIFTKSADVGADLVGKVEIGIPEDDPRNPAVIADNVGDNVGDIAGMGSDLFESYVSAIAASMVLGVAVLGEDLGTSLPLALAAAGIVASIIGVLIVRPKPGNFGFAEQVAKAHKTMNAGVYVGNALMIVAGFFIVQFLVGELALFWALLSGLLAGFLISLSTQYYTSADHKPAQRIARSAESGAGVTIIDGLGVGMMSTVFPVLLVVGATIASYALADLFGIAIAALGMLINIALLLSMDCYGPIADNAAGIAEMADLGEEVRERCEALDAVGNTTAALGKGFSVGSAALAALAWVATYFQVAGIEVADIASVPVIAGVFLGGLLPFVFSALAMDGVGLGAFEIVAEVRRQFKAAGGNIDTNFKPDYVRCVDIATKRALKAMVVPGLLVLLVPLALGFTLGGEAVAGLLIGSLVTGFLLAVMMANSGGAWDNAKKFIEAGNYGGKGSVAHKASVVGDTVGDPFKDTAGPALNILIKLVGKVAVIFGPIFVALVVL